MPEIGRNNHTAPERTTAPISAEQWSVYRRVISEARARGLTFALGGGFAVSVYTGQWRNSKDLDIYILPRDREAMVDITASLGLEDYYSRVPYDRTWIYRTCWKDIIVDVMWSMANHRSPVDEAWLERGAAVNVNGEHLHVLPVEEMIWDKLYVLQRDRCDWPDALNLLYAAGPTLDWEHLFGRVAGDLPLLAALLNIFRWLCPARAAQFPDWIWGRAHADPPDSSAEQPDTDRAHVDLLDRRAWFTAPEPILC